MYCVPRNSIEELANLQQFQMVMKQILKLKFQLLTSHLEMELLMLLLEITLTQMLLLKLLRNLQTVQ